MPPEDSPKTNRLADATSAYLRQHMNNPVDWHPWGEEAFAEARRRDVPVCVSIGYSACHWCHVMEHESFENLEIAAQMNRDFVCIKVDREERPDVDQIYMDTVTSLTGHGGWPLTVFCTPEGKPFYAGTYYPPVRRFGTPAFPEILQAVCAAWHDQRDQVEGTAQRILEALSARGEDPEAPFPGKAEIQAAARELLARADRKRGGFGDAPKFPTPTQLEFLLAAVDFLPEDEATAVLEHCAFSLVEMSRRGLYDHVGGGFHRYCVDAAWTIPHFEKMLYDQGLLIRALLETARRRFGDEELVWPVRETLDYLRREMSPEPGSDDGGGFFASQDADSEGEEGLFYVWTPESLAAVLGPRADAFAAAYGVTPHPNFENGTSHLVDVAREPREHFEIERENLLRARAKRIAPATDRKRVAAWNGYAISAMARAAALQGDPDLLAEAAAAADFVNTTMRDEQGRLLRVFAEGRAHVGAFLDDHAAMLDAGLELQRAGAGHAHFETALATAHAIRDRFFDADLGDFFLSACDGEPLAHRPRSDHDGATPHASGLAVLGLLRAGTLAGDDSLLEVAQSVLRAWAGHVARQPAAFPTLLRAVAVLERGLCIAVVVGEAEDPAREALLTRARRVLGPEDLVLAVAPGETPPGIAASFLEGRDLKGGRAAAYLCRGNECSLAATTPDELEARC
ncbi:MAG: thioredoxin domain-containing protein [Myxococcota bacterium]